METNPYSAPESDISNNHKIDIPEAISKKIKNGWIAAIVSGSMTLIVMIVALNSDMFNGMFDIWTSLDVVLIFLLAFGIYKKSRVAATFMFVYFLASKIWQIQETGQMNGLLIAFIFLYFYFQAMVATYQYQKLVSSTE